MRQHEWGGRDGNSDVRQMMYLNSQPWVNNPSWKLKYTLLCNGRIATRTAAL